MSLDCIPRSPGRSFRVRGVARRRCASFLVTAALVPWSGSAVGTTAAAAAAPAPAIGTARDAWVSLLAPERRASWIPKFAGSPPGEDPMGTFRFSDGTLRVEYDGVSPFDGRFGHLFFELPGVRYDLVIEYRFLDAQAPGAPGWAWRNSGVMLYCQPPDTMAQDQPFPVSVEVQFLGGDGRGPRATGNLCTPGTHVDIHGERATAHVIPSTAPTFDGDTWVTMHIEVRGTDGIRVLIDGTVVNACAGAVLDSGDASARRLMDAGSAPGPWTSPWIALQAESHAIEFRRVDVRPVAAPAPEQRDGGAAGDTDRTAVSTTPDAATDLVFTFEAADGTPLEAKLTLPAGRRGPAPVVFYLHGAGPRSYDNPYRYMDADGERRIARYLDFHAAHLAQRGIAFCRMSKRGCTALPEAPWMRLDRAVFSTATLSVLLEDYATGLRMLRTRPEIDPTRIVLLSSSEGTRLAPRLAAMLPDGIAGIAMVGYAADNARDTIVWQSSEGPWRNVQHLVPAARDGTLTRAEFDAAVLDRPALASTLPFDALDADRDGALTAEDLRAINRPRLDAILSAVERGDDDFLWRHLMNLTAAHLREWWQDEPNHAALRRLAPDLPLAIFHGALDGTCRVEGVEEAEAAFRQAGRTNLAVFIDPDGDHDLDWSHETASAGGPAMYVTVFEVIRGWLNERR